MSDPATPAQRPRIGGAHGWFNINVPHNEDMANALAADARQHGPLNRPTFEELQALYTPDVPVEQYIRYTVPGDESQQRASSSESQRRFTQTQARTFIDTARRWYHRDDVPRVLSRAGALLHALCRSISRAALSEILYYFLYWLIDEGVPFRELHVAVLRVASEQGLSSSAKAETAQRPPPQERTRVIRLPDRTAP
jgi:hypothetical protein